MARSGVRALYEFPLQPPDRDLHSDTRAADERNLKRGNGAGSADPAKFLFGSAKPFFFLKEKWFRVIVDKAAIV